MGRIVCDCGYDGKAARRYVNPDGKRVYSNSHRRDDCAVAEYYCPACKKTEEAKQK